MSEEHSLKRALSSLLLISLFSIASAFGSNLQFSTDHMTTVLAKGKEHTILSGHAKIINGDTTITANQIELYGPDFRYANATGDVKVVDAKRGITLTSQNLYYDRTEDLSRVEGYAEMQDTKNEIVVKGGFLENRGNEEITIVQIGVRILKIADKQQMVCRSEFAKYNRKDDSLVLSGTPVVFWKGDEYRAAQISIDLKTDEISLQGEVSGKIVSESQSGNGNGGTGNGGTNGGSGGGSSSGTTQTQGNGTSQQGAASAPQTQPAGTSSDSAATGATGSTNGGSQ